MYRYYQTGEKTPWQPIKNDEDVYQKARDLGAKRLTILALSEVVNDDTDTKELKYQGPWYADIDNERLEESIMSTRQLVLKISEAGCPREFIHIYASGAKGFHVILPETLFSSGRPKHNLPSIYMEMALYFHVIGMDFQVYSGGRGRAWRLYNVQRADGKYPVPISWDELQSITVEEYRHIVLQPRSWEHTYPPKDLKVPGLEVVWAEAQRKAAHRQKTADPVPEAWLQRFATEPPQCIFDLCDYKVRNGTRFNSTAMQLSAFVARAGVASGLIDSLTSRLATNGTSTSYSSPRARQEHVKGLIGYAKAKAGFEFSCNAIRNVIATKPCAECPMTTETKKVNGDGHNGHDILAGFIVKEDGYYLEGEEADRRITNFILVPQSVYLERSQSGRLDRRVSTIVEVEKTHVVQGEVMINEDAWNSKGSFVKELAGIGNLMFLGTDADVQRIKYFLYHEDQEMGEVIQVHESGIHVQEVFGKKIYVYVEQKQSVNQFGVRNTHVLSGRAAASPKLAHSPLPNTPEVEEVLSHLIDCNSPAVVATILGWHAACHLKVHLMEQFMQFPLLNLWGNAGAGKTMTSVIFSAINGVDFINEHSSISLPTVTPWALLDYCSSSTTVPRLLEEFNRSKMGVTKYNLATEVMKSAFNGHSVPRGTIRKSKTDGDSRTGATVTEIPLVAPLVVMSEQAPTIPALMHRMIQVNLSEDSRRGREEHFAKVFKGRKHLFSIGKGLMLQALQTSEQWVESTVEYYDDHVPEALVDRSRYAYQVVFTGLAFLYHTLEHYQLSYAAGKIPALQEALTEMMVSSSREIIIEKSRSEVDQVMEVLSHMAALTEANMENWIYRGKHYIAANGYLIIEPMFCHLAYVRFMDKSRRPAVIEHVRQFMALIRQEKYFETDSEVIPEMAGPRPLLKLNIAKMREKAINVSDFEK